MVNLSRYLLFLTSISALYADNILRPGTPVLDRPTITALGVQLPVSGDDNFNAAVSVQYRVTGTSTWRTALPLFRIHPETVAGYTVAAQFSGSIFDLKPSTSYDIQLHAVDPDGADQTWNLNGVTRSVPGDPLAPHNKSVNNVSTLVSALNSAQPGDVITLANGTYTGNFVINTAGTAANPIVIRGASEDGVILDGNSCIPCNIFEVYGGGYVHLEKMTMQNAERAIRFQTAGAVGNVIRRVHIKNTTLGIGGRLVQYDFYIADNILEGVLKWPHIYTDDNGQFANNDGIAIDGSGHVVSHNQISGYGDAMTSQQDGARANDFFGNDVGYTYDNAIELDGSEGNVRCFRNRFMNTFTPISVQPIHGGPAYVYRNVVVNIAAEQLKFHALATTPPQDPSGILIYNNTFVSSPIPELQLLTPATSHYFVVENNIFISPPTTGPQAVNWTGLIDHGLFDYNGYYPDGIFRFNNPVFGGYFYEPNFAALQNLGVEPHGLLATGTLFASGLAAPSTYITLVPPADVSLSSSAIVLDKGRLLSNINDQFKGSGPDLGALESGCPLPTYGPRPVGTDETNEVLGCTPQAVVTGPTNILAQITGKSGSPNSRTWSIGFTNDGPGGAAGITITGFTLTQQGGGVCTPVVRTPVPSLVGDAVPLTKIIGSVTVDFSTCSANSRFKLTMPFTANSGSVTGTMVANNQFQ